MHGSRPCNQTGIIAEIEQLALHNCWTVIPQGLDQQAGFPRRQEWSQRAVDKNMFGLSVRRVSDGGTLSYREKRLGDRKSTGKMVEPSQLRSARISPITGANLKPWPENPVAMLTCG